MQMPEVTRGFEAVGLMAGWGRALVPSGDLHANQGMLLSCWRMNMCISATFLVQSACVAIELLVETFRSLNSISVDP